MKTSITILFNILAHYFSSSISCIVRFAIILSMAFYFPHFIPWLHVHRFSHLSLFNPLPSQGRPRVRTGDLILRRISTTPNRIDTSLKTHTLEVLDVFKSRLKRDLSNSEDYNINNTAINKILAHVQKLMDKIEIEDSVRRSDMLETGSWFLRTALLIVQNKEFNTWERQMALEMLSLYYESHFIKTILKSIQEDGPGKEPGVLIRLLTKSLPHLIDVITALLGKSTKYLDSFKKDSTIDVRAKIVVLIQILRPETVAGITFKNVATVSGSTGGMDEMGLINQVSDSLLTHLSVVNVECSDDIPNNIKNIWMKWKDDLTALSAVEKVELGQTLVDLCLQACDDLFKKETVRISSTEKANIVTIKNEFLTELSDLAFHPMRLPMLHPPVRWSLKTSDPSGGYLHPIYNELANSKGLIHHEAGSKMRSQPSSEQINTVNYLNEQEFIINEPMLEFLLKEWDNENSLIFSIYNKPAPVNMKNKEAQEHNSLYWMYRNILNIALLFKGEVFYLPVFMDFRGRLYPLVNYLSYQGGDVARSLVCFNNVKQGNPENKHILIYLCNVFGHNNRSMESRIKWSESNLPTMIKTFTEDRGKFDKLYLSKAKEKAQFMSCFLSLKDDINNSGSSNKISIANKAPVLFDATCSGMQHLSALTTSIDLATLVNLTDHKLNDFYAHCAETVIRVINELKDEKLREVLIKLKIDRKLVKLPVMTIPYNIGLEGLTEKITSKFETRFEEKPEGGKKLTYLVPADLTINGEPLVLTGSEAGKLGSIIFHTVTASMPPIKPLRKYFDDMISVLAKVNEPVFWITPTGMKIWGSAYVTTAKRVKTPLLKNSKPVTIRLPTDNYAYPSIKRSFMANFIHSLDAANIHRLVNLILANPEYSSTKINLYTIHDCFASVNGQMHVIEYLVRKAFSDLYFKENYLTELDTCLVGQIKTHCEGFSINSDGERTVNIRNFKTGVVEVVIIPSLPLFNWEVNKEYLKEQVLKAAYFIS